MKYLSLLSLALVSIFILESCKNESMSLTCNIGDKTIAMKSENVETIEGKVSIVMVDEFRRGFSIEKYYLFTDDGKRYLLIPCDKNIGLENVRPNERIKVKGVKEDNVIYVIKVEK